MTIVKRDVFDIEEVHLLAAVKRWAINECEQRGIEVNDDNLRQVRYYHKLYIPLPKAFV